MISWSFKLACSHVFLAETLVRLLSAEEVARASRRSPHAWQIVTLLYVFITKYDALVRAALIMGTGAGRDARAGAGDD